MTLRRSHHALIAGLCLLGAVTAPASANDAVAASIARGSRRVATTYLDSGMSGLGELVDTCLGEAKRTPVMAKYAECAAIAAAATKIDLDGARRFGTPPLLKARALEAKTGPSFLRAGGSRAQLLRIHKVANPGL
jgi:hypothetical protein